MVNWKWGSVVAVVVLVAALLAAFRTVVADDPETPDRSSPVSTADGTDGTDGEGDLEDRCLSLTPRGVDAESVSLTSPGMELSGALIGSRRDSPRTGVILLPQVGAAGFCGWMPFAKVLAQRGMVALPLDLCGYGDSDCVDERHVSHQVDLAVDHLRGSFGVSRVVLVGASMGGSQTVMAVAGGAGVDAWADLSGPSAWGGDRLLPLAPRVKAPGLVVRARRDGDPAEFGRARALAERTGAAFVPAVSGHGWDLVFGPRGQLSGIGERLLEFVRSR